MKQIWYLPAIAVCIALACIPSVRRSVVTTISVIGYPVMYVQDAVYRGYYVVRDVMRTRAELRNACAWYRDMYVHMRSENVRLQASLAYAQAVQELTAFARRYNTMQYGICAAVIFRQCTCDQQMCLINAGYNRGVREDMIVVFHNILVGRVEEVYPYMSRVRLVTDHRLQVPVICTDTQTRALHCGINRDDVTQLMYVSHLESVQPGEMVITRSHGMVYPDGFGVGRVVSCTPSGLYHHIVVEPYLDITAIDYCMVIQPGAEHATSSIS